MAYIGIDLGTSAVKLIIMDTNGNVLRTVSKSYANNFPRENWSEQNPLDWYEQTISGLQELVLGYESAIAAISFSGQMHGLVLLDKDDTIIRPAILWNDQRTTRECAYLNETIGSKRLNQYTANKALTGFTAPKLLWIQTNEADNFARINKIMLPKDYLLYRLSGSFATDVSDASGTLYFDVAAREWSNEMIDILGIARHQLPQVFESYEVVGTLLPALADTLALSPLVKIVAGGGDQAVGAIGTGSVENNMCSLALGTSGVVYVSTSEFHEEKTNSLHVFADGTGRYHMMGVMLSAAGSLKWWYETVLGKSNYHDFESELQGSRQQSVYFLPYLNGERTPINDSDARGLFIGMDASTTASDMTRAVLEGVTFALRDSLEVVRSLGIDVKKVRITGGGAKNDYWCQLVANSMNVAVETLMVEEGPAFGAAILAAVGDGAFSDVQQACMQLIQVKATLQPEMEMVQAYEMKYQKFAQIYPQVQSLYKTLASSVIIE